MQDRAAGVVPGKVGSGLAPLELAPTHVRPSRTIGEDVDLRRDRDVVGTLGGSVFEGEQVARRIRVAIHQSRRHDVGEHAHSVDKSRPQSRRLGERGQLFDREAAGQRVALTRPSGRVGEQPARLGQPAGRDASDDSSNPVGREDARHPTGPQHRCHRGQRSGGVVDDLQHAVTQHQVDRSGRDELSEAGGIPLNGPDLPTRPAFGSAAFQRGQRVRARVDDGDPMPELGELEVGLLHLLLRHTSASLALNENASPDVRRDLETWFDQAVPEGASYWTHTLEGPDDMPAHVKAAVLGPSLTLPVSGGRLALGTWQGVYLCEHRDNGGSRSLVATLWGQTRERD